MIISKILFWILAILAAILIALIFVADLYLTVLELTDKGHKH